MMSATVLSTFDLCDNKYNETKATHTFKALPYCHGVHRQDASDLGFKFVSLVIGDLILATGMLWALVASIRIQPTADRK